MDEVYVLKGKRQIFVVECGAGGILGHAHVLRQVKEKDVVKKVVGARVYFTIDSEYLHSHPDTKTVYYIVKMSDGSYQITDYRYNVFTNTAFGAGHIHGLKIREVIHL